MRYQKYFSLSLLAILFISLPACSTAEPTKTPPTTKKLNVVATTTLVGDVARQIGGDAIQLHTLLPTGIDPHSFEPTPQDAVTLAKADLVIANGAGLEEFLEPLLESAGAKAVVIHASEGIPFIETAQGHDHESEQDHEGEEIKENGEGHTHEGIDPHVWMDPNLVMVWVDNIQQAFAEQDPANAPLYQANAEAYKAQLTELDTWVRQQVEKMPLSNRLLVTDHQCLGYFAARYGFEQIGAVIPSYTSLAEPSAQELAALEDAIINLGVPAVLVGVSVNPSLAQRVAEDTHVQLITFYTGSLSEPDGPAGNYLDFMRYNVNAIVSALR
ncbi:MAG: zinc ABC transporter substrate-binding protein [Anaerolineales bacterium]|nr:zinc ABC transporter substrate-binding protein [Anaerolineales bacterium]